MITKKVGKRILKELELLDENAAKNERIESRLALECRLIKIEAEKEQKKIV